MKKNKRGKIMSAAVIPAIMLSSCGMVTEDAEMYSREPAASVVVAETGAAVTETKEDVTEVKEDFTEIKEESPADVYEQYSLSNSGTTLRIYCKSDEVQELFAKCLEGYDASTGMLGDIKVEFATGYTTDDEYETTLEEAINANPGAPETVDIFMPESHMMKRFADKRYSVPLKSLGLNQKDTAYMYDYTLQTASDADGNLMGLTWQVCPTTMVYNRTAALEILGNDDPSFVAEHTSDADKLYELGMACKKKNRYLFSCAGEMYETFEAADTAPKVNGRERATVGDSVQRWMEWTDRGLRSGFIRNESGRWTEAWMSGFNGEGDTFAYILPVWGVEVAKTMNSNSLWGVCPAPASYNWGGQYLCVARGSDNAALAAEVIKSLCTDTETLTNALDMGGVAVNNYAVMERAAADKEFCDSFLSGQNPYGYYDQAARGISEANATKYDYELNYLMSGHMSNYLTGEYESSEDAYVNYMLMAQERYPELEFIAWAYKK